MDLPFMHAVWPAHRSTGTKNPSPATSFPLLLLHRVIYSLTLLAQWELQVWIQWYLACLVIYPTVCIVPFSNAKLARDYASRRVHIVWDDMQHRHQRRFGIAQATVPVLQCLRRQAQSVLKVCFNCLTSVDDRRWKAVPLLLLLFLA